MLLYSVVSPLKNRQKLYSDDHSKQRLKDNESNNKVIQNLISFIKDRIQIQRKLHQIRIQIQRKLHQIWIQIQRKLRQIQKDVRSINTMKSYNYYNTHQHSHYSKGFPSFWHYISTFAQVNQGTLIHHPHPREISLRTFHLRRCRRPRH